jgi:hypothetical protein
LDAAEVKTVVRSIARAERKNIQIEICDTFEQFRQRTDMTVRRKMLIENLLPEGTALIHGQPRSGKSLFNLESLLALASGTPAFGLETFACGDPLPVWYLTEEDSPIDVRDRVNGFVRRRGLDRAPDNFRLTVWRGTNLDDECWQTRIVESVRTYGIRLVAFEPLRSVTARGDQGPAEFNMLADFLRRLRRETNCSVLIGHHDVKPMRTGRESRDLPQRASGGAIFAFSDFPIHLEAIGDRPFQTQVTPTKFKHAPTPEPFTFTLVVTGGDFYLHGSLGTATTIDIRTEVLRYVEQHPRASSNTIVKALGRNRQTVLDTIKALSAGGLISTDNDRRARGWVVSQPTGSRMD